MNIVREILRVFRKKKLLNEVNCYDCRKYKTMMCPNSSICYMTKNKPYFERL